MPPSSSVDLIAGRYRLDSLLGRGGMGEVRAATDLRLDRPVAVKLLREDLADQPQLRARFEREARAAARIAHPHVVTVYDTGEDRGRPFLVMERLPGITLATELAHGRFDERRTCTLAFEVLAALDAAHRIGILHRDIKPGNILRADDGRAKVADFGIAKIAEDSDPATTGILLGTAAYLAPERLAGEPATPASDLYSVGVVLYEALAGRPPFSSDTPLGLVRSITSDRPARLAMLRPDVHPAVVEVVERAIAKDPSERFASATTMAAAFIDATEPSPAPGERPTVPVAVPRADREPTSPLTPPPATEALPEERFGAETGRRSDQMLHGKPRQGPTRWIVAALAGLVVVAGSLVALAIDGGEEPPSPTPTSSEPAGSSSIPAPLRRAIDDLDRAVQR